MSGVVADVSRRRPVGGVSSAGASVVASVASAQSVMRLEECQTVARCLALLGQRLPIWVLCLRCLGCPAFLLFPPTSTFTTVRPLRKYGRESVVGGTMLLLNLIYNHKNAAVYPKMQDIGHTFLTPGYKKLIPQNVINSFICANLTVQLMLYVISYFCKPGISVLE